jgi:hypothetical protein
VAVTAQKEKAMAATFTAPLAHGDLANLLVDDAWEVRNRAKDLTIAAGRDALKVVAHLRQMALDRQIHSEKRKMATFALGSLAEHVPLAGSSAVMALLELRRVGGDGIYDAAGAAIRTPTSNALPTLLDALSHEDATLRCQVPDVLALAYSTPGVVAVLLTALRDSHAGVRSSAAYAIQKHAPESSKVSDVIPTLIALLRDDSPQVRLEAAKAIELIDASVLPPTFWDRNKWDGYSGAPPVYAPEPRPSSDWESQYTEAHDQLNRLFDSPHHVRMLELLDCFFVLFKKGSLNKAEDCFCRGRDAMKRWIRELELMLSPALLETPIALANIWSGARVRNGSNVTPCGKALGEWLEANADTVWKGFRRTKL